MGAGYEKQEGQHDELYKAGVGLERVNKSPRILFFFEGALLLYCFAAFILSMRGWTPRIDLAVNNSNPFITTLLRIHLRFVLSAGSPGPELAGLDITLIPPYHQQILFFLFFFNMNLIGYASPTILDGPTFSMRRISFDPFRPLVFTVSLVSLRWTGLSSFALVFFCHISSLDIPSSPYIVFCTARFLSLL